MKKCSKCKVIKADESFGKNKSSPTGLQAYCKECSALYAKTPERKASLLAYNQSDAKKAKRLERVASGKRAEDDRKYRKSETGSAKRKEYAKSEAGKLVHRLFQASDVGKKISKNYRERAKDKIRERERNRYANDIEYRLAHILRRRINSAIKGTRKDSSVVDVLGCSIAEAVAHLTAQFRPGMSWEDRGSFHVDHKIPLSSYDLTDPVQYAAANHYTNLQPLTPLENFSKGAKT